MERYLKAMIAAGLLLLPWRYLIWPGIETVREERKTQANLRASLQRFDQGREAMFRAALDLQKEALAKEQRRLEFLLPPFSYARANLMAPFDLLRAAVPGEWEVVPEGKFTRSDPLVFWPFRFSFKGPAGEAVRALAAIEAAEQFLRIKQATIESQGDLVLLKGTVEVVFQEKEAPVPAKEGHSI
jgi:hypothetical protein